MLNVVIVSRETTRPGVGTAWLQGHEGCGGSRHGRLYQHGKVAASLTALLTMVPYRRSSSADGGSWGELAFSVPRLGGIAWNRNGFMQLLPGLTHGHWHPYVHHPEETVTEPVRERGPRSNRGGLSGRSH